MADVTGIEPAISTVTEWHVYRYTTHPTNITTFYLFYPTPAIFLCCYSMHTGLFYSYSFVYTRGAVTPADISRSILVATPNINLVPS